jgi:hypothetical protein
LCNAPADFPQAELARLTGMRWPIETVLEEAKGEVGLDHFETRTWQGWYHHMLHSFYSSDKRSSPVEGLKLQEMIAASGISVRLWRLYAYFWFMWPHPLSDQAHTRLGFQTSLD